MDPTGAGGPREHKMQSMQPPGAQTRVGVGQDAEVGTEDPSCITSSPWTSLGWGRGPGLLMVGGGGKKGRGRVNPIVLSLLSTPGLRPGPAMGLLSPGLNTEN